MTLRQKQSIFAFHVARLLLHMNTNSYEFTLGEVYRSPQEAKRLYDLYKAGKGPRATLNSLHTKKLAIDINLFKNGQYLESTESHKVFGKWWENQHPNCNWGGRYGDGNHYEFLEQPRKIES